MIYAIIEITLFLISLATIVGMGAVALVICWRLAGIDEEDA